MPHASRCASAAYDGAAPSSSPAVGGGADRSSVSTCSEGSVRWGGDAAVHAEIATRFIGIRVRAPGVGRTNG